MAIPEPIAMQELGLARARPLDPRPAVPPPAPAGRAHALAQIIGLAMVVAAVAVLAGWPWALGLGGALLASVSLVTEYLATRPPRPSAAPAPGGDR